MNTLRRLSRASFIVLQYILPQFALTRAMAWLTHRESRWFKNAFIRVLVRVFNINTEEALHEVPDGFASANQFFTRALKPDSRPLALAPAVISPSDGTVSQCGSIRNGELIQAKGFRYSLTTLLGDPREAAHYANGVFVTIYLAPSDYHRVHSPLTGVLTTHRHIPGQLFSVNHATAAAVPRLFARNERRVFCFGSEGAQAALVMVGALNVGSISTPWHGDLAAGALTTMQSLDCPPERMMRGDLLGWFNLGSTVVLILPEGFRLDEAIMPGRTVRMGDAVAHPILD